MVSGRPLLYLSLPGVAFILGVFWFRRRNKNRIENDTAKKSATTNGSNAAANTKEQLNVEEIKENTITKTIANGSVQTGKQPSSKQQTKSMNINGSIPQSDDENPANRLFGKSAPIKIIQNGRCAGSGNSPAKQTQQQQQHNQQIDSEVLKSKIQDAEHKLLRSIDEDFENLSSPVDLPDSINNRMSFYARNVATKKDSPVVIMASTTPKISPENSFMESKYTKDCAEQNNNLETKDDGIAEDETALAKDKAANTSNTSNNQNTEDNTNDKRKVDAASPSLSLCSVQSGDSGKGSSLPRSEATRAKTTYEFFFPNILIGKLYGRKRTYINNIKAKTNATIVMRKKLYTGKLRICAIDGSENEIQAALAMIRQRFPAKRYPNLSLQKIHFALPQTVVPLSTESLINLQLNLIEGINNDVVVSAIVSGGHIFVQHPLHPTHPSLALLQKSLYDSYVTGEAPLLPCIELSAVCVMQVNSIWYRVQIVDKDAEDAERCYIKFLDFGGYMNVHFQELRQIRSDFMSVPFQATECVLSNVEPIDDCWSADAADVLCNLTKGIVLQAQIAGYNSFKIPEIYLFACVGPNNVVFINKELVARNLAKWVDVRD